MRSTIFRGPCIQRMISSFYLLLVGGPLLHVKQCHSIPYGSLLSLIKPDLLWIPSLAFILWPRMGLTPIVWPKKTCLSEIDGKERWKKKKPKLFYNICITVRICVRFCIWANGQERNLLQVSFGSKDLLKRTDQFWILPGLTLFELSEEMSLCGDGVPEMLHRHRYPFTGE